MVNRIARTNRTRMRAVSVDLIALLLVIELEQLYSSHDRGFLTFLES